MKTIYFFSMMENAICPEPAALDVTCLLVMLQVTGENILHFQETFCFPNGVFIEDSIRSFDTKSLDVFTLSSIALIPVSSRHAMWLSYMLFVFYSQQQYSVSNFYWGYRMKSLGPTRICNSHLPQLLLGIFTL